MTPRFSPGRPTTTFGLLPACAWHAVNAYGIKVSRADTYDGPELNPFRQQPSGVREHNNRWEVHCDPYDVTRVWVRDHWNGGNATVFWTELHRVADPFGEMAWDHARSRQPGATEEELADAVLQRPAPPGQPGTGRRQPGTRHAQADGPPGPPCRRPHEGRPSRSPPPGQPPRNPGTAASRCSGPRPR